MFFRESRDSQCNSMRPDIMHFCKEGGWYFCCGRGQIHMNYFAYSSRCSFKCSQSFDALWQHHWFRWVVSHHSPVTEFALDEFVWRALISLTRVFDAGNDADYWLSGGWMLGGALTTMHINMSGPSTTTCFTQENVEMSGYMQRMLIHWRVLVASSLNLM